jgi:calcineurin-like phosphoesterase family protein
MVMIWFSSDWHLGHTNIIKYCDRPFDDSQQMDRAILNNYILNINDDDQVYLLGDLGFNYKYLDRILSTLPGHKYWIPGNHDRKFIGRLDKYFIQTSPLLEINYNNTTIVMCHYPMVSWHKSCYGSIHLFGHCHGSYKPNSKSLDVGVDSWNFKPVSVDTILNTIKGKPNE